MSRPPGRLNRRGLPARLLDFLETDGGWLTTDGLAMALDEQRNSVDKALDRLKQRGLVENRLVPLATAVASRAKTRVGVGGLGFDSRTEWRFLTWGAWHA
jgi:hypothetical protein